MNNSDVVCLGNTATYRIENYSPPSTVGITPQSITWQAKENMNLVSGQNSTTSTFVSTGNKSSKVAAQIKWRFQDGSEKIFNPENDDVWVGAPATPTIISGLESSGKELSSGSRYTFSTHIYKNIQDYEWRVTGAGKIINNNLNSITVLTNNVDYNKREAIRVDVLAKNKCGSSSWLFRDGYVVFGPGGDYIEPLNGSKETSIIENKSNKDILSVKIYSISGILIHTENLNGSSFNLQSVNLDNGVYIVKKTDLEGNITREKVLLKK